MRLHTETDLKQSPQKYVLFHNAKLSPISQIRDVHERLTQRILGRYPNEFSIKTALQKFTLILIVPSNAKKGTDGYTNYAPRTDFAGNSISPNFFENKFVQTFGPVDYRLERCGIWFVMFLFLKLNFDIIVSVMRVLEIHRKTGKSLEKCVVNHLQPVYGFKINLNPFTNQSYRKLNTSSDRNAGVYRAHFSLKINTTQ